jgi:hypothetical protein
MLNERFRTKVKRSSKRRSQIRGWGFGVATAKVSARGSQGDRGIGANRSRKIDRSGFSPAIGQKRAASSDRMLFIDDLSSDGCGNGEGLANLEASITKRHATARKSPKQVHGDSGKLDKRKWIHL